jgi:hypothetical protein
MPVYQYEGQHYDLPDGLSNEQAIAKIEAYLGKTPAAKPSAPVATTTEKPEAPSSIAMGFGDIAYGAGQLLAKGMQQLPESLTIAGRPVAASARAFAEKVVPQREAQYEAQRQAAGEAGFDFGRLFGNIINPASYVAAPVANPVVRSAVTGGLLGSAQPVSGQEDFWSTKALQAGLGAVIGPLADAGVAGAGKVIEAVRGLTPAGREKALQKYVEGLAGPEKEAVVKALQDAKELVSGSRPTVGEALSDIPSAAELVAAQAKLSRQFAGKFETRAAEQQAARARAIQGIAGTEAERTALAAERAAVTGPERELALTQADLAAPVYTRLEKEIVDGYNNIAAATQTAGMTGLAARTKQAIAAEGQPGWLAAGDIAAEAAKTSEAYATKAETLRKNTQLKQYQLKSLEENGFFPLKVSDITDKIDAALKTTVSDTSKTVLQNMRNLLISKADENGIIGSRDLYENVRKPSNQQIAQWLNLGEQYASGGIPKQAAEAIKNVKTYIDTSLDQSTDKLWSKYLNNYSEYSNKLNRMEVGEYLSKALNTNLDKERAAVFSNAVDNAAATIKQATGIPRYEKLEQVLTPKEVATVNSIVADLTRQSKAKELASKVGKLDDSLVDVAGAIPPWLDKTVTVLKEGIRFLQKGSQDKFNQKMTELMLDPQKMAQVLTVGVEKSRMPNLVSSMMKNMNEANRNSFIQIFTIPTVAQQAGE